MLRNYLLTSYKVMMRRKLFTGINLLCVVLTLTILLVVTALLDFAFRPSGVEGRSERFLQVTTMEMRDKDGRQSGNLGYKVIDKYLRPMKSAVLVAAVSSSQPVAVYQADKVSTFGLRRTDASYWDIMDFTLLAGRVPSAGDVTEGRFVAVINAATARQLFPGPVAMAIGKTIPADGQQFTVIGVVEGGVHINSSGDIWVPVTTFPSSSYRDEMWGNFTALLMAKSAEGLPAIRQEVRAISAGILLNESGKPVTTRMSAESKVDMFASMLLPRQKSTEPAGATLLGWIVSLMLLFMLLPALNLVNLNTGRIMERSVEIGVRKAFGATSTQLVGQLIVENVVLCLVGGAISLALVAATLWGLKHSALLPGLEIGINLAVFGYGLLITVLFGLLSGVIPAWTMSRLDPVFALKGAA
ncbi:MAG: ABC transporter permease [Massilia sp.]